VIDDNEYFDDQNHFQTLLGNDNTHGMITNSINSVRDNLANYLWDKKIQRDNRRNRYNFNSDEGNSE